LEKHWCLQVVEEMEGFRCEKCGKNMSTCGYRYVDHLVVS
jgi:hypothetical protein